MAVSRVSAKLYAATRQAPGGMVQQAIAAVENALLDIKGRALGVRVCDLLGGAVRERLELYWSHCGTYRFGAPAVHIDRPPIETLDDLATARRRDSRPWLPGAEDQHLPLRRRRAAPAHAGLHRESGLAGAEREPARHRRPAAPARGAARGCRAERRNPSRPQLQLQDRRLPPGHPSPRRPRSRVVRDRPLRPGRARAHPRQRAYPHRVVRVAVRHPRFPAVLPARGDGRRDRRRSVERSLGGDEDRGDGRARTRSTSRRTTSTGTSRP